MDVALSAMSKLSSNVGRLQSVYLRFIFLASCTTLPLFVLIAALAPEICIVLFGDKWAGAELVTRWLCLLGAVQVVQFFNSSALGAAGKANQILFLNILKFAMGGLVLWFADASSISEVTLYFVFAQLTVTPFSFAFGMRVTGVSLRTVLTQVAPGVLSAVVAFCTATLARSQVLLITHSLILTIILLGLVFVLTFASVIWLICSRKLVTEMKYVVEIYAKR